MNAILAWFHTPFQQPLDPWHILLMVGLVLVGFILWSRVLAHLGLE